MIRSAADVRALIAAHCLPANRTHSVLGDVTLHAHQRSAADRLRVLLSEHRGALLADQAGLGKTYVAAVLMREAERPLLVLPASLRHMWREALRAARTSGTLVSYTALSRGALPPGEFDLVVLDEAHHARNAATRRYAALASLCARARVLLLSATPVHNRASDLAALFALFRGSEAWAMSGEAFAQLIVRRERDDVAQAVTLPEALPPEWITVSDDATILDPLLSLPPPLPPAEGGAGGALLTWSLLRQWASSRGALAGALRRRIARGIALESALEAGHYPNRNELRAWSAVDDAVQLAFPQLIASPVEQPQSFLPRVRAHLAAVRMLLGIVRSDSAVDASRARALAELCERHPGEKMLAFSQYTDTVHALFGALRHMGGVAALSARGARVASGRLTRQEALARFAPRAMGCEPPPVAERIGLLLTTDLASEGLNLHDASVIVHLDLPWTPARLEQRVARSRRIGALHSRTRSYAFAPPAAPETVLRVERRLRGKLRTMEEVIGVGGTLLPATNEDAASSASRGGASSAQLREHLNQLLEGWRADRFEVASVHSAGNEFPHVASVRAQQRAVLALVIDGGVPVLAGAMESNALCEEMSVVIESLELMAGADATLGDDARVDALGRVERWLAQRGGARA
ncbi:MAG: DEAD/DEAH box helicase, partial [Chloroflexota bacterium]|nr:DEAD/DEAH box helicase [Chloroflexota bacterium]